MAINEQVSFTWVGHGTWRVRSARGKQLLLDAWVMNNPVAPPYLKRIDELDLMLISHGHGDHIHDAIEIANRTQPTIVGMPELVGWLAAKGVPGAGDHGMNKGGTQEFDGIKITMVHAEHSCGILDGGVSIYAGEPCGYVIEFENGFKAYFAGDTDVFGDMALIGELDRPDVAILPIGDHYTMGPRRAAKAVELLGVGTVLPMHFGTFPALTGRPSQLQELVGAGVRVLDIKPGETI
ncbi:MAG: metal-dependent hydrolase [Candidatus Dormibacteraceae bacterium]